MNHQETIELTVLQYIFHTKDEKLLTMINVDWFTNGKYKLIFSIWSEDFSTIDPVRLVQTTKGRREEFISTNDIITLGDKNMLMYYENETEAFTQAVKAMEEEFLIKLAEVKLKDLLSKIKEDRLEESAADIVSYFYPLQTVGQSDIKDLNFNFEKVNQQLVYFGEERTALKKIIPLRKSIIVIGGDSGHHKTNQGIEILLRALQNNLDYKAMFFSREMDFEELRDRLYSRVSGIDVKKIISREVSPQEVKDKVYSIFPDLKERFIIIEPSQLKSSTDMARLIIRNKPDVCVLDFLQYFAMRAGKQRDEQNARVMEMSASCKEISQLTNTFGIALSQLKKKPDGRLVHFPRLDDLEWSGLIKHLAHSVGMCFWPKKIDPNLKGKDAEWYCTYWAKVRNGSTGNEFLKVTPETGTFNKMPVGYFDSARTKFFTKM